MVGAGGPGGNGTPLQVFTAFLAYAIFNLFLNFFNKWALSSNGAGFTYPVFYSTWHMLMSIIGSTILMRVKVPATGLPSFEQFKLYKYEALTLAFCSTINITCNNASLMKIGLFVNQVIKALSPLLSMLFSFLILKRKYSLQLIASVIFIAVGAGLSVPFKDPSFSVVGVVLVLVATFASSLKPVVGELLMSVSDKPKLAPAALVFYDSCFSFCFMLSYWICAPTERSGSIDFMSEHPALGWGIILAGSLAAFSYNMTVFYFTMVASALAVMVATNLLKVLLITAAAVMENVKDPLNWIGITLFFVSVFVYAYLSFKGKQKKADPPKEDPKATEKTKLVSP